MYVKIYFNNKPLFLADKLDPDLEPFRHHDDAIYMDEFSTPSINSMIHEMKTDKVHAGVFVHTDLDALKKAFFRKFKVIKTGGGLIINDAGEYLLIYRREKWDLPKGKLDEGETLEQCTLREINEETGLKNLSVLKHLINTYHTYDENGKHILKDNAWYLVKASGEQKLQPQLEEQITDVKWIKPGNFSEYIKNTMPSIIDVLKAGEVLG
jgi:8-oxo-dGTP pyrophosphatase MutT (NUDIX family)